MKSRRTVLATSSVLGLLVLGGVGAAYATHYSERALPRTTLGGLPVAGMSREQVAESVKARYDEVEVTLRTESGHRREDLADLGYALDVDATVDAVFAANASWPAYATSLVSPRDVAPVLDVDSRRLKQVADELVEQTGNVGTEAGVRLAEDGQTFVASPAVIGKAVVMTGLQQAVANAGRSLSSTKATVEFVDVKPTVTTAEAKALADKANALVGRTLTVSDGTTKHLASAAEKAAWVKIPSSDGAPGAPVVKAAKVKAWVESLAQQAAATPSTGMRNVSSTGRVLSVVTPARDGRVVSNADQVAGSAVRALKKGTDFTGSFSYKVIPATWNERKVAAGAENLAYPAAEGEKWIDVNLSRHTMTAYVGGRVVRGPVAMVNGAAKTPTVVGTFRVYHKNPLMTMRGFNADGSRYETPNVPWSSFFHNGYALHGAPWRSSFGYSDSHGCVNLPVDVARWVYGWAVVGTPVVSHH